MSGPRILIVEDDPDNAHLLGSMLAQLGCVAETVESGEAALEAVAAAAFDAVLMDVRLPGIDGLETARRLRASGRTGLPIVAVTAAAMEGDRERCLKAGMDGYLTKPFTLEGLGRALAAVGIG